MQFFVSVLIAAWGI